MARGGDTETPIGAVPPLPRRGSCLVAPRRDRSCRVPMVRAAVGAGSPVLLAPHRGGPRAAIPPAAPAMTAD